jgi:hypothetical protein
MHSLLNFSEVNEMDEKYINAADCAEFFYEHLDDNGMTAALNAIEEMPAADVKPVKHGRWIRTPSPYHFKCSSCGIIANIKFHSVEDHKFCWHCGARMDGGTDDV